MFRGIRLFVLCRKSPCPRELKSHLLQSPQENHGTSPWRAHRASNVGNAAQWIPEARAAFGNRDVPLQDRQNMEGRSSSPAPEDDENPANARIVHPTQWYLVQGHVLKARRSI